MSTNERQLELAEEHQTRLLQEEVKKRQASLPSPGGLGPQECVRCFDLIPIGRRKLGYNICIECAERKERGGR